MRFYFSLTLFSRRISVGVHHPFLSLKNVKILHRLSLWNRGREKLPSVLSGSLCPCSFLSRDHNAHYGDCILARKGDRGKIGLGARPETCPCHLQFTSLWARSLISMHQITSLNLPDHSKKQVWLIPFYRLSKLRSRETK